MAYDENGQWVPDVGADTPAPEIPARVAPHHDPNQEVLVVGPTGWRGAVPISEYQKLAEYGWRLEAPEETEERKNARMYGDAPGRTFVEGAVSSALPLGVGATLTTWFDSEEAIRQRRARNKGAAIAGSVAGSLIPLPGTVGWGALKAGAAAKGALAAKNGLGLGGRLLTAAGQGAVEGAVFGANAAMEEPMLSADPINAEQFAAAVGHGLLEGAAFGGVVGGGFELLASGAKGAKSWYKAFKNPDGLPTSTGSSLEVLVPRKERLEILKAEEGRLAGELKAEREAIKAGRKDVAREKGYLEEARAYTREERQAARDQFEVELGVLDEVGHQAESRSKLLKDVGGWPDDVVLGSRPKDVSALPFSEQIAEGAKRVPAKGRFGEHKVFINDLWESMGRPGTLDDFKAMLVKENSAGRVELVRADLVGIMDPAQVKASEAIHAGTGTRYNFVSFKNPIEFAETATAKRINPMRELVDELGSARAEVQKYFPHAGETVTKRIEGKRVRQRMFELKASPDDVARVMGESGDAAKAAIQRYEQAVINMHNAVNADGRKALSAHDFWQDATAPHATLSSVGEGMAQEAKLAERISTAEGLMGQPIASEKLATLEREMTKVREALKDERGVSKAAREAMGKFEAASPGITKVDEADIDRVLAANKMPNTPQSRDVARYHLSEQRVSAASSGKTAHNGLGDVLGKGLGYAAGGYAFGALSGLPGGMVLGPVAFAAAQGLIRRKAANLKVAADGVLGILGKTAKGIGKAARATAIPAAVAIAKQDDAKGKTTWQKQIAPVLQMANPDVLDEAIRNGPVGAIAVQQPEFAMQVRNVAWTKYQYLAQTAPKSPYPESPFGGYEYEPPKSEQLAWNRRRVAADDPESVLRNAADGTVTPEEVETLAAVYPETYQAVKEYMTENAVALQQKWDYQKRLTLSILFQEPVEPMTRPEMVQAFQASYEAPPPETPKGANMGALKAPEQTAAQRVTTR